ncbi:MAG: hypothetical protein KAR87_04070 [Candidatus Aenigmarchaeota archaeon]|nr:hypothetical protein [Candidatus Aenigmarchaeota archaeon]
MNKIVILVCTLLILSAFVSAAGPQGTNESETGAENPQSNQTDEERGNNTDNVSATGKQTNPGNDSVKGAQNDTGQEGKGNIIATQQKVQNTNQLKERIQEQKEKMDQELQNMGNKEQNVYKNQNRVRESVHALLAMENFTGKMGPQISAIAREFNNSVQATIKAEEKIQTRSTIARLFAGGDSKTAEELEGQINQNRLKIQELKQLKEECECDEEIKTMMQEQIQNMEQEQERLGDLAQKEKKSKGLLGWLWK